MFDTFKEFLEKNKIWHEFLEKDDTRSTSRAANVSGVPLEKIVKSLVFRMDGEFCLIILQGSKMVSRKKLRKLLGKENITLAAPEEVLLVTGYEIGAVPPIGHKTKLKCILDKGVTDLGDVWAGGGAVDRLVHLKVDDIIKFNNPIVADVSE